MIYRRPPDSDWSFAPERGNKEIQGWEEKKATFELSHPSHSHSFSIVYLCPSRCPQQSGFLGGSW